MIGLLVLLASRIPISMELTQSNVFALNAHKFIKANSNREYTTDIRVFRLAFSLAMIFSLYVR